jgi:hypothetical protein
LSLDEKYGGSKRQRGLMKNFQRMLEECGLSELGNRRPEFTWNNGQGGADFIKERLDHVVANKKWCEAYSDIEVVCGGCHLLRPLPCLGLSDGSWWLT